MPSVNDLHHKKLESDCEQFLRSIGFTVASNEPHLRPEFEGLKDIETIAAHTVRTRPDRVAIKGSLVIQWDAKTSGWSSGRQFAIEAIPFINACLETSPHVFVCRRKFDNEEFGILAGRNVLDCFDKIMVPKWRRGDDPQWIEQAHKWKSELNLDCSVLHSDSCGSGDMFVTLNIYEFHPSDFCQVSPILKFPHWKQVFAELCL
jgi:hypothetical protein